MSSLFRSPFKPRTPLIVTTPVPQFALTVEPPSTSTSRLAPDSSRANLRPPHPTYPYQPPNTSLSRPRSVTFRSSPLAGSVISSESLCASPSEGAMDDEKKIQLTRKGTETGKLGEKDAIVRPGPKRVVSTSELSSCSRLRFSDTFETREKLLARPSNAHLSSRRPLSDLSILRPINNVQETKGTSS